MSNDEELKREVNAVILTLEAIAKSKCSGFGDGYKQVGINFSLTACEIAAKITGANATFCKMLNYKFRMAAADLVFERALAAVG